MDFCDFFSLPVYTFRLPLLINLASLLKECQLAAPVSQLLLHICKILGDYCFKYSSHGQYYEFTLK